MSRCQRVLATAAAVAALVCAAAVVEFTLPAPAQASNQVSMLIDDEQLIYSSPKHMVQTLQTLHTLGVDVVKVSLVPAGFPCT